MIEEREVVAARFWKEFDRACGAAEVPTAGTSYQRASLVTLFTWYIAKDSPHASNRPSLAVPIDRFDRWWREAVRSAVEHVLGDQPEPWSRMDVDPRMGMVLSNMFDRDRRLGGQEIANIFDHRFLRMAEREMGVHRFTSHFSAVLTTALFGPGRPIIDVFSLTGEVHATSGNERWRSQPPRRGRFSYLEQPMPFRLELLMRLHLHDRDVREYRPLDMNQQPDPASVFHILAPRRGIWSHSSGGEVIASARTAMNALAELRDRLSSQFCAMAIASGAERGSSKRRDGWVRRELVDSGVLVAVIDLPRPPGTRTSSSAWVILPARASGNDVLMVDLSGLDSAQSQQEFGGLAEFAARLVRTYTNMPLSPRWATPHGEEVGSHLRELFDRQFADGYRDIEGLCRSVKREEVAENDFVLQASRYLELPARPAWLSGIDGRPLVSLLGRQVDAGRTFYVTGNNGEGKSLLLSEIAREACSDGRRTVGIASSLSDRFPFDPPKAAGFESFVYEGLRTTALGTNERSSAAEMCKKFLEIHRSAAHLACLVEALDLIEFKASRYVLPMKSSRTAKGYEDMMQGAIALTDDSMQNMDIAAQLPGSFLQIALVREGSRGGITPYLELSSGERQIVGLVVKILVHARQGCLFLIDEPEISLHVRWQRVLPRMFSEIAQRFKCDIVIATHSPLIVTSASDARSICFSARRQRLVPIEPRDRRSVEAALFKGFATHTANNRLVHERCAALVAETIAAFNQAGADASLVKPFLDELSEMRRVVHAAAYQLEPASLERSMGLIHAAQEAINQLAKQSTGLRGEGGLV